MHKYKKKNILILFLTIVLILLIAFPVIDMIIKNNSSSNDRIIYQFKKNFEVAIPENVLITNISNSYEGIHNDGELLYTFQFDKHESIEFITNIEHTWNHTPLSDDINILLYGGYKNGINYQYNLGQKIGIPIVENGFWCIVPKDIDNILLQYSFDFTLSIFDTDTNILYYYKINT
ncbi:MAG: hypothetical protein Q4F88_06715 [Eubacteriales bacterium]|nr:hypothetical protein [Eubacteriales bacterium]